MLLTDYEKLMGVKVTDDKTPTIELRLASAVAHINQECGGVFADPITKAVTLPVDVQMGAALLVDEMDKHKNNGVASRTLGDMSTSFFEGGAYRAAAKYWKAYRKVRFY